MAHIVKCLYCGKTFDRDKVTTCRQIGKRFAHLECAVQHEANKTAEVSDREKLFNYAQKLLGSRFNGALVGKQVKQFQENYNYTYSGMLRCLTYAYEVKKLDINKSNGIGIIPYIYQDAYNYYYNLWLINQKNGEKRIEDYIPNVVEVKIPQPELKPQKRKLFTFLDEEEKESNEQ